MGDMPIDEENYTKLSCTPERRDEQKTSCILPSISSSSEDESYPIVPKKVSSLPKSKLDDFIKENIKYLESIPDKSEKICEPYKFGGKVLDVEAEAESNDCKISRTNRTLYETMKSINEVDSPIPGKKRALLKNFLKKEIENKKLAAFNRKKGGLVKKTQEPYFEMKKKQSNIISKFSDNENLEATVSFHKEESCDSIDKSNSQPKDSSESEEDSDYDDKNYSRKRGSKSKNPGYIVDNDNLAVTDESSDGIAAKNVALRKSDNDDDDDIKFVKSKKIKVLEKDNSSDDDDIQVLHESHTGNACNIEERSQKEKLSVVESSQVLKREEVSDLVSDSEDSVICLSDIPSPKGIKRSCDSSETDDSENSYIDSSNIASSIPCFQPQGGFVYESQIEEPGDAVKAAESKIMQVHKKNFCLYQEIKEPCEDADSNVEEGEDDRQFGFKFDHPPIPEQENESDPFSSQDIADVCSGVFKSNASQGAKMEKYDEACMPKFSEPGEGGKEFIEMEAELSGDENNSEDEEDDIGDDKVLDMINDEEIPQSEQLRENIASYYMKQKRDEDNLQLNLIQEQVFVDGDLHSVNERQKRYAWNSKKNPESTVVESVESEDSGDEDERNWNVVNKEKKAQFLQEKSDDLTDVSSSYKKSNRKMKILGKNTILKCPETTVPIKRKSYLDSELASEIIKKLKEADDKNVEDLVQ